jgi:hypothetical protein
LFDALLSFHMLCTYLKVPKYIFPTHLTKSITHTRAHTHTHTHTHTLISFVLQRQNPWSVIALENLLWFSKIWRLNAMPLSFACVFIYCVTILLYYSLQCNEVLVFYVSIPNIQWTSWEENSCFHLYIPSIYPNILMNDL